VFDIQTPKEVITNVRFGLPGHHNLMNALTAFSMAYTYGVASEKIVIALASFPGIRRRFSFQIREEKLVYIDDYAHHPTEINAVHQAVRELYPNKKIIAAFQPHLFSRTKDFIDGFASSLSQFDEILLLEIYPARELPMEGVNSSWLLSKITNKNKKLVTQEELLAAFKNSDATIYITIGAGDIGEQVKTIKELLNEKV
jgi:UDP-N-acetylmuramate--alanine ligase